MWQIEAKSYDTEYVKGSRTGQVNDYSGFFNHSNVLAESTTPRWITTQGRKYSLDGLTRLKPQSLDGTPDISATVVDDYLLLKNAVSTNIWNGITDITKKYKNFEISATVSTSSDHIGISFCNPNTGDQAEGYQWVIRIDYDTEDDSRFQK
jgi:hypothetical protein